MQFNHALAFALSLLLIIGCEPLSEEPLQLESTELGYTPLDSLPADYGQLVAVTPHSSSSGPSDWYELWFSDSASGKITLVPVWRPGLSYRESGVTVIERTPSEPAPVAPQSVP